MRAHKLLNTGEHKLLNMAFVWLVMLCFSCACMHMVEAGLALGSYPGHPRWNPNADLIEDGIVDIFDMVTMALHFGETC